MTPNAGITGTYTVLGADPSFGRYDQALQKELPQLKVLHSNAGETGLGSVHSGQELSLNPSSCSCLSL